MFITKDINVMPFLTDVVLDPEIMEVHVDKRDLKPRFLGHHPEEFDPLCHTTGKYSYTPYEYNKTPHHADADKSDNFAYRPLFAAVASRIDNPAERPICQRFELIALFGQRTAHGQTLMGLIRTWKDNGIFSKDEKGYILRPIKVISV